MNYAKHYNLPLGSITAQGFLREQLLLSKDGIGGHLPEIEPAMIHDPYIKENYVAEWQSINQAGWGAEISGNYWTGLILLAFTLQDEELMKKAEDWINAVLKNRREDGYLGTYRRNDDSIYEDYNAWGTACGMRALLYYYDATGREDVFDAVYKCMLWFCDKWAGDRKTVYAGSYIIIPMMYCYHKTSDERLLTFCEDFLEFLCEHDVSHTSYKAFLEDPMYYTQDHTANMGTVMGLPASVFTATGDEKFLKASTEAIRKIREKAVHITGGPVSVAEYLAPVSATAESEYCCFTFFNFTYAILAAVTGSSVYGDYMEEIAYNCAQGARLKNERAIAYLSAPNQVYATKVSTIAGGEVAMQAYSPCYPVSCCPVNAVVVLPEFVSYMAMRDSENRLYLNAYGPCQISYGGWELTQETLYPFRNDVTLKIKSCPSSVCSPAQSNQPALFCKKPGWAKEVQITVGGTLLPAETICVNEQGYLEISSALLSGIAATVNHELEINMHFTAEVEVIHIDDSDACSRFPMAFKYGALVYSLPIKAREHLYYPNTHKPDYEKWPWYDLYPYFVDADAEDDHERTLRRKDQITWNVALDAGLKPEDILVEEHDPEGYVWSNPCITMKVPGYKAPFMYPPYPIKTPETFEDTQVVTYPMELTLVPYGCTNLRITYFARARL